MSQERIYTPEEKKKLEIETGFVMFLAKTKVAKLVNKDFFVTENGKDTLLAEISPELRKELWQKYEDQQLLVLESIMYGQLLIEVYDQMDSGYYGNMTPVKTALGVVKKKLTGPIERDFHIVYRNGNKNDRGVNESNEILKELELQAKEMSKFRVPAKVVMSKLHRAFNYDNDVMMATADRIIKKHERTSI